MNVFCKIKIKVIYPRELSSVGRDITYYMQESGSNPGHPISPHLIV